MRGAMRERCCCGARRCLRHSVFLPSRHGAVELLLTFYAVDTLDVDATFDTLRYAAIRHFDAVFFYADIDAMLFFSP